MNHNSITKADLQACLERSGYLLESKIVRELTEQGYFVEPNQVILDKKTGKSREIDIIAEHYSYDAGHRGTCVKTYFVAEVVNNRYPIVLLTPRPFTPNSNQESYVKFHYSKDYPSGLNIFDDRCPSSNVIFSQYCGISTKKGEARDLMANHPDDMYSSLQKLSEYVEDELELSEEWVPDWLWRIFFWHPMLIAGGQLFTAIPADEGDVEIQEVDSAFLEFNWHRGAERQTTLIEIVTVKALYDRLASIVQYDRDLESRLHELHVAAGLEPPDDSIPF